MAFSLGRFAQGAGSGAAVGSVFGGVGAPVGAVIGGLGSLFEKSDKEIRQAQVNSYIKRRAQRRLEQLASLDANTSKNIGRINQFTTGNIKNAQGDIASRSASKGRGADEADFLSAQGQITSQGSGAIQSTQDMADKARLSIEDAYNQDVMNAEMEGITYPEDPNFTDVLGSLAPAALQYGMNQQYLKSGKTIAPTTNPSGTASISNTGYDLSGADNVYDIESGNQYRLRKPVKIDELQSYPSWFGRK